MLKIAQVYIQDNGPFQNLQLDLTYPEGHPKAGQAMDRICLLGENATAKPALMGILVEYLRNTMRFKSKALFLVKLQLGERFVYSVHLNNTVLFFRDDIDQEPEWMFELLRDQTFTMAFNRKYEQYCIGFEEEPQLFDRLWLDNNGHDIICHVPADYSRDQTWHLVDVPLTKGHEAESYTQTFPLYNEISPERSTDFWALLIYLIVRRNDELQQMLKLPENKGKSPEAVKLLLEQSHPDVLKSLAAVWNPYLEAAGMELGWSSAILPAHIRDRLSMYVQNKRGFTKVEYGSLELGMRRTLFTMGHIWALGFRRDIRTGFYFVEEPERNLHPKMISTLRKEYEEIFSAGQSFFTSNSIHFARQFEPEERVILHIARPGQVETRRGRAPLGASLDEIQDSDFN